MKYRGIDLHSNNAVVAVIDDQDRVLYCKRLANDLSSIIAVLAPFHEDLQGVVVESTYYDQRLSKSSSTSSTVDIVQGMPC
ncbi:hypothetical protein [Paraburkholderia fungorum]|uniref:hypothetical protein n=1 Tax=Paraburkholderia fungorum TaxID=134537 RepID=UPI0020939BA6|nr:hypothetical protein [Paraburkholderia fungorum]USU14703.1 hypothetical protein NFE55_13960 [Paraburkholderia fungorum]USU22651.1 hypothetical protein NFS19_13960 [Paraburkholderia fungorum]